jgi:hypothetical protein
MVSGSLRSGADYIEVFNPSPNDIELTGVELIVEGDGRREQVRIGHEDDEIAVNAGSYWVMTGTEHDLRPAFAGFGYGAVLGTLPAQGSAALYCDGLELDRVSWEMSDPQSSLQLSADVFPTPESNDSADAWCFSPKQYLSGRYGSPRSLNNVCFPEERLCRDELGDYRPKTRPEVGDLVITEVMANPSAADDRLGEWFEIYARHGVDLNDIVVVSNETENPPLGVSACLHLAEGARAVFARSEAAKARLPRVDHTFETSLVNTVERLSLQYAGTELDSIAWDTTSPGVSWMLDPDHRSAEGNDVPENWCLERAPATNGDIASPGLLNSDC